MIIIEEDDLPGVVSWWPEAAEVVSRFKQDFSDRKVDGVRMYKQRTWSKTYYQKHQKEIDAKRKIVRHANKLEQAAVRQRAKEHYWKNREAIRAKLATPEARAKARIQQQRWRSANQERINSQNRARRAAARALAGIPPKQKG